MSITRRSYGTRARVAPAHVTLCALPALLVGAPALADVATAHLINPEGEEVGVVSFAPLAAGGVHVTVSATGLPPGVLGFHIHEVGACDPADGFDSAGGHVNPTDADHGWDAEDGPHAGDLPNLHVHEDGSAAVEHFATLISLNDDDEASLFAGEGTAVIIHAHADDYQSDPTGHAGERIACGVIERE
jgi:Cu-Zn family superoxide dismutase